MPSAPRSAVSTRSGTAAKLVSPSSDAKTAPPMRAAPQKPVRIVPENHCTETRRRSTRPVVSPSTESGGSLPRSMAIGSCLETMCAARPCRDPNRRPLRLRSKMDRRKTLRQPPEIAPPNRSGTMPVGPRPVNDRPRLTSISGYRPETPPKAFHPDAPERLRNMASVRRMACMPALVICEKPIRYWLTERASKSGRRFQNCTSSVDKPIGPRPI